MNNRRRHSRRALSTIWIAITGFLLIGFLGLAMDLSLIKLSAMQLQATADGAALAGALQVKENEDIARQMAIDTALANVVAKTPLQLDANSSNNPDGDIVFGRYDESVAPPIFIPTQVTADANAVKVVARRTKDSLSGPLSLVFGPIFGVDEADVQRTAIARVGGTTGAGMIMLCPDCSCALEISGNTVLDLQHAPGYDGDASIQVNSNANGCQEGPAVCGDGSSVSIQAPEMNIVADDPESNCWAGHEPDPMPLVNPSSPSLPDPLEDLPAPPIGPDLGEIRESGVYAAGYYSGGIRITSGTVTLQPGIYVVDNVAGGDHAGLVVNGGNFTAHNVMFYIIGQGEVDLGGNGNITITPPTSGIYEGISIFQARNNSKPARIIGTSNMELEGTLYFPNARVAIGGDGIALGNQVIAWTLDINGSGTFTILYDGRFPSPGYKVWLAY